MFGSKFKVWYLPIKKKNTHHSMFIFLECQTLLCLWLSQFHNFSGNLNFYDLSRFPSRFALVYFVFKIRRRSLGCGPAWRPSTNSRSDLLSALVFPTTATTNRPASGRVGPISFKMKTNIWIFFRKEVFILPFPNLIDIEWFFKGFLYMLRSSNQWL